MQASLMRTVACFVAVLSGSQVMNAAPEILPPEVKAEAGKVVVITPNKEVTEVRYRVKSGNVIVVPKEILLDQKSLVLVPLSGGKHVIEAWGIAEGKLTDVCECQVIVPGPPDPPLPVDALTKALQAAYDSEPKNRDAVLGLVGFYQAMSEYVNGLDLVKNPMLIGDIIERMDEVRDKHFKLTDCVALRKAIAAEMQKKIGEANSPVTEEVKLKLVASFSLIAKALANLK